MKTQNEINIRESASGNKVYSLGMKVAQIWNFGELNFKAEICTKNNAFYPKWDGKYFTTFEAAENYVNNYFNNN